MDTRGHRVVRPEGVEDVVALVRAANAGGERLYPVSTGLYGPAVPRARTWWWWTCPPWTASARRADFPAASGGGDRAGRDPGRPGRLPRARAAAAGPQRDRLGARDQHHRQCPRRWHRLPRPAPGGPVRLRGRDRQRRGVAHGSPPPGRGFAVGGAGTGRPGAGAGWPAAAGRHRDRDQRLLSPGDPPALRDRLVRPGPVPRSTRRSRRCGGACAASRVRGCSRAPACAPRDGSPMRSGPGRRRGGWPPCWRRSGHCMA